MIEPLMEIELRHRKCQGEDNEHANRDRKQDLRLVAEVRGCDCGRRADVTGRRDQSKRGLALLTVGSEQVAKHERDEGEHNRRSDRARSEGRAQVFVMKHHGKD
jgi:hypothetical protein